MNGRLCFPAPVPEISNPNLYSSTNCRRASSRRPRPLQNILMAETRNDADAAFDHFIELYETKYDKAAGCPQKGSRRVAGIL